MCDARARETGRARLRGAGLPRHGRRRTVDGGARARRLPRRRARRHDDGARGRARRRRPLGGARAASGGRRGRPAAGRLARRARHGQLRPARDRAGEVRGPQPLCAQPDDHADADDAGGERRARARDRPQALGRDGPDGALRPAEGRLDDRRRRPAVLRRRRRRGAAGGTARDARRTRRAARGRHGHQRPRVRDGDGGPPARVDPRMTRSEALARLRAQVESGKPIIGAGAGTGLSAKLAEAGGADLIIIYNSGRYRMGGRGSLAGLLSYGDANAIVVDMAREVLPVVKEMPVLAGVNGTDPFRLMPVFLDELKRIGFSGVQNFPTVGLIDGTFRAGLEETGMGFGLEVDMIRLAHERDFLTAPYVFDDGEATAMAQAGADVLVPHMGLTTGGAIGAESAKTLDESGRLVQGMHDAAKRVNPDILVLCHGGPIAEPDDAAYVLANTEGVVGFFCGSSMERLPTEVAMTENMRRFKAIPVN